MINRKRLATICVQGTKVIEKLHRDFGFANSTQNIIYAITYSVEYSRKVCQEKIYQV